MGKPKVMAKELKKDAEFTWKLFEHTGSVGAFLVYKETQKNITIFEKAKSKLFRDIFETEPSDN